MKLAWHCGLYVGQARWQNSEDFEPDECSTDFETDDHSQEDWDEKCCSATCPSCGGELTQRDDNPTIVTA